MARDRDLHLPVFSREGQPDIAYAQLDSVKVVINNAFTIRFETMAACNRFKDALANSEIFVRGQGAEASTFSVRGGVRGAAVFRRVIGGADEDNKRWLFHGSKLRLYAVKAGTPSVQAALDGHDESDAPNNRNTFRVYLDLTLNPARFINHCVQTYLCENGSVQDLRADKDFRHGNPESEIAHLLAGLPPRTVLESFPARTFQQLPPQAKGLGKSDNLIPAEVYRAFRPAPEVFDILFSKVLGLIREEIESTLVQTQHEGSYQFRQVLEDWNVRHAEVFWEYSVANAIAFVHSLRGLIMPMFSHAEVAEYVLDRDEEYNSPQIAEGVERNSPYLKLGLGRKGVELAIYAKTFDRVRFEIKYNGNVRSLADQTIRAESLPPEAISGVMRLLQPIIKNAQHRLEKVFGQLPDLDFSARCDLQTFVEFLAAVSNACHEHDMRDEVIPMLSLLASTGGIEATPGSAEYDFCESLKARGMFIKANAPRGHKRYALHLQYWNVLRATLDALATSPSSASQPSRKPRRRN